MLFRKWGCLVLFSGNWFPLIEKKWLWLRKSFYTFIFTSKYFWKNRDRERERERESERARGRRPSSSPVQQSPGKPELQSAPILPTLVRRPRSEIAIDGAVVGLELAKHCAVEPSRVPIVDDFFFMGFVRVFLGLSIPSSFPNTKKYFSENFLKSDCGRWTGACEALRRRT